MDNILGFMTVGQLHTYISGLLGRFGDGIG